MRGTIWSEECTPKKVKVRFRVWWGSHLVGGVYPLGSQMRCTGIVLPSGLQSVPPGESKEVCQGRLPSGRRRERPHKGVKGDPLGGSYMWSEECVFR